MWVITRFFPRPLTLAFAWTLLRIIFISVHAFTIYLPGPIPGLWPTSPVNLLWGIGRFILMLSSRIRIASLSFLPLSKEQISTECFVEMERFLPQAFAMCSPFAFAAYLIILYSTPMSFLSLQHLERCAMSSFVTMQIRQGGDLSCLQQSGSAQMSFRGGCEWSCRS